MENKEVVRYHRIIVAMLCMVFLVAILNFIMLVFNAGNILDIQEVAEIVRMSKEQ